MTFLHHKKFFQMIALIVFQTILFSKEMAGQNLVEIEGKLKISLTDYSTTDSILIKNSDVQGVIGSIGSILANHDVNIADFSLARNENAKALAVILVDNAVDDKTLNELLSLDACTSVNYARI